MEHGDTGPASTRTDRFTVTISRFAQATAVEPVEAFDDRFGVDGRTHAPGET